MTAPLPVRPTPRPGEPLTSYAGRLADANGLNRGWVLAAHRRDVGVPTNELSTVANLAGLTDGEAAQLTMDRYPPTVRGLGPTHRGGWRLHFSVEWVCPRCTAVTGHRELLWQTALMPVCLRCGSYLAQKGPDLVPHPAPDRVLTVAASLADRAEASITSRWTRQQLGALRRLCASIAQTAGDDWPPRPAHWPPVDQQAAREWGAYPSPDPVTVGAVLAAAASPTSRQQRDLLVREAITRARSEPNRHPSKYLPHRPPAILQQFAGADKRRLSWFRRRLRHHIHHDGLRPDHVPTTLPATSDRLQPPGPGQWLSRARAATALHLLIGQATGLDATPVASLTALGVPDIPTSLLIEAIHTGRGLRHADAAVLTDGLDLLLQAGLMDYQRRRDILRTIGHLPPATARCLTLQNSYRFTGEQLAMSWIWMRFTHGPMRSSRWPSIPDRDVHKFAAALDPETLLILHETGQQLLADADLTTIPFTHATQPVASRRYG